MRPILLKGHERPISFIQYNREGDLIFSASRDALVTVWYTDNGERLGTYNGHRGAVLSLDVNFDTTRLLTAAADQTAKIWDVQTGKEIFEFVHKVPVRTCAWATGDRHILTAGAGLYGNKPKIFIYNIDEGLLNTNKPDVSKQDPKPVKEIGNFTKNVTQGLWSNLNTHIYCSSEDGTIRMYDVETGELVAQNDEHTKAVNRIAFSKDKTMLISASADHTAKLIDAKTLKTLKTYKTDKPVNAASISPLRNHVVLGGGQEASQVTVTHTLSGKFDARFFHTVFEEEIGTVKGHFGPINAISFSPDGRGFATGGEDGFVRIHHFDNEYFKLKDDI